MQLGGGWDDQEDVGGGSEWWWCVYKGSVFLLEFCFAVLLPPPSTADCQRAALLSGLGALYPVSFPLVVILWVEDLSEQELLM